MEKMFSVHRFADAFATSVALIFLLRSSGHRLLRCDSWSFSFLFEASSSLISPCVLFRVLVSGFLARSEAIFFSSVLTSAARASRLASASSSCLCVYFMRGAPLMESILSGCRIPTTIALVKAQ